MLMLQDNNDNNDANNNTTTQLLILSLPLGQISLKHYSYANEILCVCMYACIYEFWHALVCVYACRQLNTSLYVCICMYVGRQVCTCFSVYMAMFLPIGNALQVNNVGKTLARSLFIGTMLARSLHVYNMLASSLYIVNTLAHIGICCEPLYIIKGPKYWKDYVYGKYVGIIPIYWWASICWKYIIKDPICWKYIGKVSIWKYLGLHWQAPIHWKC